MAKETSYQFGRFWAAIFDERDRFRQCAATACQKVFR
jgi:hypothetical protein